MGHMARGDTLSPPSKGHYYPNCSQGTCNPINFTVLKPSDWTQGQIISIRIDGQGFDPGTLLHLELTTGTHENSPYQVFHSFYEEMPDKFPISVTTKNLFLTLAESIPQTLNVTSCYVCGGPTWETTGPGRKGS
jgi:hypothetical protein